MKKMEYQVTRKIELLFDQEYKNDNLYILGQIIILFFL